MPNWNDPNSIKAWLAKTPDNGKAESQAKAQARQQNEQRAAERQTPSILKPLVNGEVQRNGRDAYYDDSSPTGRKRAEPQNRQRVREPQQMGPQTQDDRTRIGNTPWKGGSLRDELNVPVQRSSMLPGLPQIGGTPLDWIGQGDSPAAKYADWQSQQDRTDNKPELFPGYDNVLDFSYQFFDAPGRALTTTPFLPTDANDRKIMGTTDPNAKVSIAELGSYVGQTLNQTFNPFNPNKNMWDGAANQKKALDQVKQNYQFRADINSLPPDQREAAWRVWTSNAQSNNAPQVFDEIVNRPQKVEEAQGKMQQAQASGDTVAAARWGQEVERLNNLDERELIESKQNPWAEIVFGVALDPVDWVTSGATELLGLTPKLAKAAKAAQKFNIDPEVATKTIDNVVTNSAPVVEKILAGQDIRGFWEGAMNPIARTAETRAYLDTRNLTETAMLLATNIKDKVVMQSYLQDWLTTGGQDLIKNFGVGAGVLGNKDVVKSYPILKAAEQGIVGMKTLQGEGPLDVAKFIPEFAKVIEDTARTAYGVKDQMNPAMKAISFPSRFLRAVLVDGYLNLAPRNWIRQAASQTANVLGDETYSLRPLSSIVADVAKKTGGIAPDMRFQSDAVFTEAAAATQAKHWTQYFGLDKNNPIAQLSRKTGEVWQGGTTLAGGTVAVGEQAFYDKIYGTTMLRSFNNFWNDAVSQQFLPAVEALGLEPEFAKSLANVAIEAGKTGGKDDVSLAIRKAISGATIKDTSALKIADEIMPLELRGAINDIIQTHAPEQAAEAFAKVQGVLTQARQYAEKAIEGGPPTWRPEFTKDAQLDDLALMAQNLTQLARKGGMASKEAGAGALDLARNILKMEDDGYKAFMGDLAQAGDPKAMDYALDLWQRVYDLKTQARQSVDAINAEAIKAANAAGSDKAARSLVWQEAYGKTAQAWQNYVGQFQGTIDEGRQALLAATNGQPLPASKGWNDVLERYWQYDKSIIDQAQALDPGGTWDGALATVRDANRAMVDHASTELFDVLRRFPTTDSLDIINSVMRQADSMGAQVAGMVRKAAEEAKGSKDWESFYAYRNHMWNELAQDSVEAFAAAKRGVVWNWLADQVPTKLRWSDDFAGDFQLVGPLESKPGYWIVRDGNGQLAQLAEEGSKEAPKAAGAAPDMLNGPKNPRLVSGTVAEKAPSGGAGVHVPRSVIDDYNTLVKGNLEDVVDDVLDDISPFADPDEIAKAVQQPQAAANDFPGWEMDFGDQVAKPLTPKVTETAPVVSQVVPAAPTAAPTTVDVRKAASGAGIGTDKTDKWLLNSITKNKDEIGLTAAPRTLNDLTSEDLAKVKSYYDTRAAAKGVDVATTATQAAPEVAQAAAPAGRTVEIWSDPARKYSAEYDVVELDDLVASNDVGGAVNKSYPGELQPRDRSQAAAMEQVQTMAQRLDPAELLSDTNALDRGSPIVTGGNVVLSGNGRTMSMRLADATNYSAYRQALIKRAEQLGIDPATLEGMKQPVLVRRLPESVDGVKFAQEANQRTTLAYNAVETAKTLAGKLTPGDLANFVTSSTDNLRQALSLSSSKDFVQRILGKLPDTERAALVGPNGELTTQGVDAIRGALFSTVFPESDAVLRNYVMNPQPDLANIGNAIEKTIGKMAQLQLQNPDLAIGKEVGEAAMLLLDARNRGESIANVLQQGGLFGEMDPAVRSLVEFMDANLRTSKSISTMLNRYADEALKIMGGQEALFAGGEANKADMLQAAIKSITGGGQGSLLEMQGGLGAVRAWPDWMVPRGMRKGLWKPTGKAFSFTPDGDAYESIKSGIRQARMAQKSRPEMGDVALSQIKQIDQLEKYLQENLTGILAGAPNTLTPAMQVQVLDLVNKKLLPNWDNVMGAASEHGKKMGEFAMMDFNDRRNFDTALALVLPFHYYFTRSAGNWLQRIAAKPALLDLWLETQGAIAGENQRTQVVDGQTIPMPARLQGTVPNPLKEVVDAPWMPDRLQNPLTWSLPFSMYAPSSFTEEIESDDETQQILNSTMQYIAEKAFPWYQAPMYAWMDQNIPVAEGQKPRLQQFMEGQQIGDYLPQARTVAYGLQAAGLTGAPGPAEINGQKVPFLNLGTEFDPYFQGRVTRNEVAMGNMTEERAQYANQYLLNQQQGKPLDTLIPPDELGTAKADAARMAQQTGVERFGREFGGWLTGMTNQYYPEGEQQYQAASQAYRNAGYGPENLGGSKDARTNILEQNPELPVGWGISNLIPGAEPGRPPGASQQISATYDTAEMLQDVMKKQADAAVDAAIKANPNITNKEMNAIRDQVEAKYQPNISSAYDKARAMGEQFPLPEGSGNNFTYPGGMNPAENKLAQADQVFKNTFAMERPADGASKAEKDAFYKERDASAISGLVALGYTEDEAAKMWQDRSNKNYTPNEIAQREKNRIAWETYDKQNAQDWQGRRTSVAGAYGEDAANIWDQYLDLPKGDARRAFKEAHPEIDAYNLAAFEPSGYAYLSQRYGADSVMDWARIPKWSEDKAQQEQRTAYLDARPKAWMVDAWVDGRPKPFDATTDSTKRNYGTDWQEAEQKFGADIWDKVLQYRTATGKDRYAVRDQMELKPFLDWWYGQMPKSQQAELRPASAYRGGGGRAFPGGGRGGGGGGGGGGGYGNGGGDYQQRLYVQQVDPRYMNRDLEVSAGPMRPWRQIERVGEMPDWLYAGQNLKPSRTSWR